MQDVQASVVFDIVLFANGGGGWGLRPTQPALF